MDKFARTAHALLTTCRATQPECSSLTISRPLVSQMEDFFRPLEMNDVLTRKAWLPTSQLDEGNAVIDPEFVRRFLEAELSVEECRRIGFREQMSRPELIERTVLELAGTVLTLQLAFNYGIAANVAGGTHHAHPSGGAGYTILNDIAVASHVMLSSSNTNVRRILVIDCDVHQGDGTAKFGAVKPLKDKMFTLSLHCASNYPHPKAFSTYDVGLPDGMEDEEYLRILKDNVVTAVEETKPDMVIFDAGVDVYQGDVLGRLKLTENGIRRRDFFVLDYCVSRGIPVAAIVGGGYDKCVDTLARRHAIVHEECARVWQKYKLWETAPDLE